MSVTIDFVVYQKIEKEKWLIEFLSGIQSFVLLKC